MGEVASSSPAIDGVRIIPLKQIRDERGMVMHMLRADAPHFERFGEIYFSQVKSGVVKAWKKHKLMKQFFAVPFGTIKLVIFDDRAGSPTKGITQEFTVGVDHYGMVIIPPMVWYGFQALGGGDALIANCPTMSHDPSEVERLDEDADSIPFRWGRPADKMQ